MILPIYAYGQKVLKKVASAIDKDYKDLDKLIENMWETMYNAQGVGLAAPQIGKSIRMFMIDTVQIMEEGKEDDGFKMVFINAKKIEETGKLWPYEEGCLSIPNIRGDVQRNEELTIEYMDESFKTHRKTFKGINARVVQHEYDHIEGELFVEKLKPLKKKMIKRKLEAIKKGTVSVDYRMRFAKP